MVTTNDTKLPVSLQDTSNLRQLILDNPDLPLIIFCGDESWDGEHAYNSASASKGSIQELALYDDGWDETWMEKEEYREKLEDDLYDDEEYKDMSDEEFNNMIDNKIAETEFVRAIVIYVG